MDYIHHPGETKSVVITNLPLPRSLKMLFAKRTKAMGPAAPQHLPGWALLLSQLLGVSACTIHGLARSQLTLAEPKPHFINKTQSSVTASISLPQWHSAEHTESQTKAACSFSEPDVRNEFPAPESRNDPQVWEKRHSERREHHLSLQLLPRLQVKQFVAEGEDAQSSWFTGIANQQPAHPLTGQGD